MKALIAVALMATQAGGAPRFTPAQVVAVTPPVQAPLVLGASEVWLELDLDETGKIVRVKPLRTTPPYTDLVLQALTGWRFSPAKMSSTTGPPSGVKSSLLVAGIFRPPALYLGATGGEVPRDVGAPLPEVPDPARTMTPVYPAQALSDGVVIVEAEVGIDGRVTGTNLIYSGAGFDEVALDAARQWTFRPARRDGRTVPAFAYLIFGFRQPVTGAAR